MSSGKPAARARRRARPGRGVRLCIMRRPPQGMKSRLHPAARARRREREPQNGGGRAVKAGDGWMADHAVVADDEVVDLSRRRFLTRATIATGAVGAAFAAVPFIESWSPSERARAPRARPWTWTSPSSTRADGHHHLARAADLRRAAYPRHGGAHRRARRGPEGSAVEGLHAAPVCQQYAALAQRRVSWYWSGSAPTSGACPSSASVAGELYPSWPGGFFCPCHGSRFDLAGRVFDGSPASINLRVPPYSYPKPHTLRVGADEKGSA